MRNYYLNKNRQPSGDFEVHLSGCNHGALPSNQIPLGYFNDGVEAVKNAKQRFPDNAQDINGCAYCCPEANTD